MDQHVIGSQPVRLTERAEKRLFSALHLFPLFVFFALAASFSGCTRERSVDHVSDSQGSGQLSPLSIIKRAVVEPDPIVRNEPIRVTIDIDENRIEELKYEY